MSRPKRERLGKGLGALLGEYLEPEAPEGDVRRIRLAAIVPNPLQPRKEVSEEELAELVESIRENGLLQPLVVRPSPTTDGRYELVAGERRLRSIQRLEWSDVPVVVRDVDDEALLVLALVENLQREALSPMEEAEGYRTLGEKFGLTQEEIARSVGKDRSTVANFLRLLKLPPSVRRLLEEGQLSTGHARALLAVDDPVRAADLARRAVEDGWSVREVERRVRDRDDGRGRPASRKAPGPSRDPVVRALEESLREALATRVVIKGAARGKGVIEIPFHGTEDFERIFALLAGREASDVLG